MNATPKALIASQDVANGAAVVAYTSPTTGRGTYIDYFAVFNHDSSTRSVTINFATDGAAAGSTNEFVAGRQLAVDELWLVPLIGSFLPAGGKIYLGASAATAISMVATGRELTD